MVQPILDSIDTNILESLQTNGRLTNLELAERVGLSPSPCLRRVRRLEEDGIIEGYRACLNRERMGFGVVAFVRVNIERHRDADAELFMKEVSMLPEVLSCYVTSGESDFLLQVVVADLSGFQQFALKKLIRVPGVKDIRSSFVLGTVKEGYTLPIPKPTEG